MKMKKNNLLFVLIIMFFASTIVNAERNTITIEGSGDEYGNSTVLESDGSFLVVGEFDSTDIDGFENRGDYDGYIIKYDKNGKILWKNTFGGNDYDSLREIVATEDDGYIAVGETCSTDIEGLDITDYCKAVAVKYDNNGKMLWQKTYGENAETYFNTIEKTPDNSYIIGGGYISSSQNGYIVNIDETGSILNHTTLGNAEILFIRAKETSGYLIGNYTQKGTFYSVDKDLNIEWSINCEIYRYINDAIENQNGEVIIVGSYYDENDERIAFITKFDKSGNMIWNKDYEEPKAAFNAVNIDEDGNYIVTGGKKTDKSGELISDALVITYDDKGNIVSEETIEGKNATWLYGMDYESKNGYVYVGSSFENGTTYQDDILIVFDTDDFIYDINTKIVGNGTITISQDKASANTNITFTITPEKGYKLSAVKVTDANGNTVTFKDYTFTMPSSNVTIEAIFIKDETNPDTTDVAVISCIIIIVLGLIGTIYSIRKLIWLK